MLTIKRLLSYLAILLPLTSCAEYNFRNQTWIGSLGADCNDPRAGYACGAQFDTLDSKSALLTKDQFWAWWTNPANQAIATNAATEQDLYTGLRTLCSDHPGECSQEVQQKIQTFFAKAKNPKRHMQEQGLMP